MVSNATTTVKSSLLVTHTTNPAAPKQNQDDKPSSEEVKDLLEIPLYDPEALSNNLISEPEQLLQEDNLDLDEAQAEEEAESMLRLIQEMKQMREQTQALNDEDRRKKAEEMIIKLSQYM